MKKITPKDDERNRAKWENRIDPAVGCPPHPVAGSFLPFLVMCEKEAGMGSF
ncbi:MAG TPA: hypothetical protein VIV15_17050 [Anaerolineales bacterium]